MGTLGVCGASADRDGEARVAWVLGDGRTFTPLNILRDPGVEAPVMSLAYGRELGLLPPADMGDGESGSPASVAEGSMSEQLQPSEVAYGTFPEWWRPGGPADYHVDSDHESHHSNPSSPGSEVEPVWVPDSAVQVRGRLQAVQAGWPGWPTWSL
jgi:hypothetical protein